MPRVVTFAEAVRQIDQSGARHRHVLLGNGFSRALKDDIFSYSALFDKARFGGLSDTARKAFTALGTTDFEVVMRALRQAAALASVYATDDPGLSGRLLQDAEDLKELLARTIAASHPDRPNDITSHQYVACRTFLGYFERIYTVNYDLLLYWALMQSELEPSPRCDDGFRQPDDGPEDYVTWDVQKTDSQNVYYLHGALHVFDAGHELQKFTWVNTQIALIDQIREALSTNRYPLFVSEGDDESKLERIQHSGFLNRAYRSFASIGGALFTFGLSFAQSDEHIVRLLDSGKTTHLVVSLFGDPNSQSNRRIVERVDLMKERRSSRNRLTTIYFDAQSAQVWG